MKLIPLALFTCCLATASSISLSLDLPLQAATAGSFLDFSGTITNTGADVVYLNGADVTLPYFELSYDLTPFFTLWPTSLGIGEVYGGDLFTVAISGVATTGDYFGALSIQGGSDSGTFDDLASQSFDIGVSETAVPEPSSAVFLVSSLAAAAVFRSLRKRVNREEPVRTRFCGRNAGAPSAYS